MEKTKKLPKPLFNRYKLLRRTKSEKVVFSVTFIIFLIYSLLILTPIIYLLFIGTFVSDDEYYTFLYRRILPDVNIFTINVGQHFENYKYITQCSVKIHTGMAQFPELLFNSVWFCFFASFLPVFTSSLTGYVIAKYKFKGRNLIYSIVIFCMTIPIIGTTGAALKLVSTLGIKNTPWYVILTSLGGFGFNFMVLHAFFKNVSWNYVEAVLIDGGGHFTAFFKVMLPQASSAMTTLIILSLIGTYNDYTTPLLFLEDYPTIASGIYQLTEYATHDGHPAGLFAALLISILPIILLFSIFSDRIMKNFSIGGLKG